jgi:hypothetical protein
MELCYCEMSAASEKSNNIRAFNSAAQKQGALFKCPMGHAYIDLLVRCPQLYPQLLWIVLEGACYT